MAGSLCAFTAGSRACAADGEKQLVRVAGTVEYQQSPTEALHEIFGQLDLPDDAVALTLVDSRALVRLADSTEIDIGARTRFRLGSFSGLATDQPRVVTLELGAMHFVVRHPAGQRSNYVFVTPTSQIAVRGTEGYVVTGPTGTDFYCVSCAPGDVTVTIGARSYGLKTGQQAIVVGANSISAHVDVIDQPCGNPAAIAISDGKLGRTIPLDQRVDTTGALDGDPLIAVPIPGP
jgi:hypothetical protein